MAKNNKPFSTDFSTYQDWKKAHPEDTPYNRRINNAHKKYPNKTLKELRGHSKPSKNPQIMELVIQGNAVTDTRSSTAGNVYIEVYIQSSRTDRQIAADILKHLNLNELNIYPKPVKPPKEPIKPLTIAFREHPPKGKKIVSQRKMKNDLIKEIESQLHAAGQKNASGKSHHSKAEQEMRNKRREQKRNDLKKRYDDNEFY